MRRLALALLSAIVLAACASAPTPSLDGRWKSTGSRVFYSDGAIFEQVLACVLEFSGPQSVTECRTSRGVQRMVRQNRDIAPGRFESEIVEDKSQPRNVGRRSQVDYRIERDTLVTTAYPPAPKDTTVRYPVKIEAQWVRDTGVRESAPAR